MPNDKKAFVFDTNFIVQVGKLDEVIKNLKDNYTVYVTQVSIDERIAQQCRELKENFDELENSKQKFSRFAEINFKKTYSEECEFYRLAIQEKYEKEFGKNLIPFSKNSKMFSHVIDRANKKLPPFSSAKNASDKGLKDCLLWLSMMDYFKIKGESKVVFVTDDNSAFRNHIDFLSREFEEITGKSIEFKPNTFYKELMKSEIENESPKKDPLPDVAQVRERLSAVVWDLCRVEVEDEWGECYWEKTFILNQRVDGNYMKVIFNGLYNDIESNMFKKNVSANSIFDLDDRLYSTPYYVNITSLESAYRLHEDVKNRYPDFLDQFYETTAEIFNENYSEPLIGKDDDLPF